MDLSNPKEFDDPQVFDNPKGISIGSMDFDNPKVNGNTSIFDGLAHLIAYLSTSGLPSFLRNRSCLEGNIWKRNIFGPSRRSKKEKEKVDYSWS